MVAKRKLFLATGINRSLKSFERRVAIAVKKACLEAAEEMLPMKSRIRWRVIVDIRRIKEKP